MDLLLNPNKEPKSLHEHKTDSYTISELKEYLGGDVELIYLPIDKAYLIINKKYQLSRLGYNEKATEFLQKNYPSRDSLIHGKAILTNKLN